MKSVLVTGPGTVDVVEVPTPTIGPTNILVRIRACGICGSDAFYIDIGGMPPRQGATPLGHEPAGEIAEIGSSVLRTQYPDVPRAAESAKLLHGDGR